jgi:hypothetical protein
MRRCYSAAIACLACSLLGALVAHGWDGQWTDGKSGQDYLYDKDDSTGKAGTEEPAQVFLIPPPRDYMNVDPEELDDYFKQRKKDYSPYALLRLPQAIRYEGVTIPKGYYEVKAGEWGDGSPNIRLNAPQQLPPLQPQSTGKTNQSSSKPLPGQRVLIIKRLGNVIAVVPIHEIRFYKPPRKDKIPKRALAWLETEERQPVLKYYEKHWIFSTRFQ